jgi:ankyrin repeat protein
MAGHIDVVRDLLDAGADVDGVKSTAHTPLMSAAASGHRDVLEALLRAGADIQRADENGYTALRYARGHADCEEFLRAHGLMSEEQELTKRQEEEMAAAEREDLARGIDDEEDPVTLIARVHGAMNRDLPDLAIRAIQKGADIDLDDREREDLQTWTVAAWAAWKGHADLLRVAIEAGAWLNAEVEAEGIVGHPLAFAVLRGNLDAVKVLVDAGADVNAKILSVVPDVTGPAVLLAAALGHRRIYDILAPLTDPQYLAKANELWPKK